MRNIFVTLCLLGCASASHAALGGSPTVAATAPATSALKTFKAADAGYTVRSNTQANGTLVKEFVANNGVVFAVVWEGPFTPDLKSLLGDHFGTMTAAANARPMAGNSQLNIDASGVVIQAGGHMRARHGRAWLPANLPAGVSADDIQ